MLKRMKTKIALVVMAAVLAIALAAVGVAMADNHMGPGEDPNSTTETQETQTTEPQNEETVEEEVEVESEEGDESYREKLIARAAEILGVTPEELKSALEQAHDEMKDEHIEARIAMALAKLVEKGKLTQAQADELMAWIKARPEWLDNPVNFLGEINSEDDEKERNVNVQVNIKEARQIIKQRNGEIKEHVNEIREEVKEGSEDLRKWTEEVKEKALKVLEDEHEEEEEQEEVD